MVQTTTQNRIDCLDLSRASYNDYDICDDGQNPTSRNSFADETGKVWIVKDKSSTLGFTGYAFENQLTGEIVIAFRGTDNGSLSDYINDIDMAVLTNLPLQALFAAGFYNKVSDNGNIAVTLTGHSLVCRVGFNPPRKEMFVA